MHNLPDYTILLPSRILLLKDDSESQSARQISSVLDAIMDLWPFCGCSHPPCSAAERSLFALTVFSHKFLPQYLHKILLLFSDTFLIIAIFSKGWCCLPHLQDSRKQRCLKKSRSSRSILHMYLLLNAIYRSQFLCGTTCSYLGQRSAISASHKVYLWNPNNNNAR